MNEKEVKQAIDVLDLRERVVVKLVLIAGMRVSELFWPATWKGERWLRRN